MKKKLLLLGLALVMVAGFLVGCGGSSGSGGSGDGGADTSGLPYDGVTLTLWGGNTELGDNAGFQALRQKATETLGMTFEIELNPGGTDGDNIIKTKLASGDVADIINYNTGSLFMALNPKNNFLDITDEPFAQKFDDSFKSVVSVDGRVYGAPQTTTQAGAVVYWKPDYEELGLEVPKTWADFLANCDALEAAGKTSVLLTCGDTWSTQVLLLGDLYNVLAEEPTFAEDFTAGTAKFATTPAALRSWEKYTDLVGRYNADASAATYQEGIEAMGKGEATHWIILTQSIPEILRNHPESAENIGVFGIPGDNPENAGLTVWEPNGWAIYADTPNKEAALAFMEFWFEEENMDTYIELFGANGPSCIKGYTLPESVCPAIRVDMQSYFDEGKTAPALEFLSPIKGTICEQLTTAMALGQGDAAESAAVYDDNCKKSAVQQGLNWN